MTRETKAVRAVNAKECFMKKVGIIAALFLVLMLAGCQGPVNVADTGIMVPEGMAKVRIPLPGASNARAVGLAGAQTHANFFEVAVRDSDTGAVISAYAPLSKGYIEVVIPPGTYDILLFVGENTYTPANPPLLLASAYAGNVNITTEKLNTVYFELDTFDVDLMNLPSEVKLGQDFDAGLTINTKNPLMNYLNEGYLPHRGTKLVINGGAQNMGAQALVRDGEKNVYWSFYENDFF
jgi:hypothetical protein